jgi:hypothetical protein
MPNCSNPELMRAQRWAASCKIEQLRAGRVSWFERQDQARHAAEDDSQLIIEVMRGRSRYGAGMIRFCDAFHTA